MEFEEKDSKQSKGYCLFLRFRMSRIILHPFLISSIEMFRGGVIRAALGSYKSQKSKIPLSIPVRIRWFAISSLFKIKASIKPLPRISSISS